MSQRWVSLTGKIWWPVDTGLTEDQLQAERDRIRCNRESWADRRPGLIESLKRQYVEWHAGSLGDGLSFDETRQFVNVAWRRIDKTVVLPDGPLPPIDSPGDVPLLWWWRWVDSACVSVQGGFEWERSVYTTNKKPDNAMPSETTMAFLAMYAAICKHPSIVTELRAARASALTMKGGEA